MKTVSKQQKVQNALETMEDALFVVGTLRDAINNASNAVYDDDEMAGDFDSQINVLEGLLNERLNILWEGIEFVRGLTQSKPRSKSRTAKPKLAKAA